MKPRNVAVAALFGLVLIAATVWVVRGGGDAEPLPGKPLRVLAKARGMELGTAVRGDVLKRNRAYRQLVAAQFSTVTPENEMKWDLVEPSRGEYEFGPGDDIVERAREASPEGARAHARVALPATRLGARARPEEPAPGHARAHSQRHGRTTTRTSACGTSSTSRSPTTGGLRPSVFARRLGPGFIEDAFRTARVADSDAKLYLNEIGAEGINPKSNRLYEVVRDLKARGVPIDGVGFQTHANLTGLPADFVANMQRFRALGLDVAITEADVALRLVASPADLQRQAEIYAQIVRACETVKCASLTFWGFTDGRSWISETQAGMGAATLLDDALRPKPAFGAVQRALAG